MKYGLPTNFIGLIYSAVGMWIVAATPGWAVVFVPSADNTAPLQSSGDPSRSSFQFIPPPNNPTPRHSSGGSSRVGFIPPLDGPVPVDGDVSRGASFIPPPNNPTPRHSSGGSSRHDDLIQLDGGDNGATGVMLALIPPSFYGLTVSSRPTFMAYLPASRAHKAIFSLQDAAQAVVYERTIPLSGEGGILQVSLPQDAPELAVGKPYRWFITLQTEDYLTPGSPYVDAWIKRIEPTSVVSQAIASHDPLGMTEVFAREGLWYDASAQLASLQLTSHSPSIADSWAEFLTSVDLDFLIGRSFLGE
ncbi:DUF928 domain-containing protein [Leptothoe spongobia]|uniref:DUF928 domain-containing protein n=1 Tax=Leptothoe spongobia TAU-MAC 1115 TaxID=1967444 RepID=A0A947GJ34_9CYAN|nr:DUF928 domain-containing protein [Leptothoe spongobia]MBT9315643.1 DUF928 domain-containing protein [Leptothoe spongobia TAU-MAC 1115]